MLRFAAAFVVMACVGGAFVPAPAYAETVKAVPLSKVQLQASFAPLVKETAPAVVNIYTRKVTKVRQNINPFANDPFFRQFFGKSFPFAQTMPKERVERALGSGVIIDSKGVIVTNNHVIDGATEITVVLADRREFPAELVGRDPKTDLAVLRISPKGQALPALSFGSEDSLEVGDIVLAIGNPFGLQQTVTSGIVSALARTSVGITDYGFFIQTDAAINPGNSGGALVDMQGRLVGLNSAIYSRKGSGSIGIGFAIPSQMVKAVTHSILVHGKPIRAWFGAAGETITQEMADSLGMAVPRGAIISDIMPDSPAASAGLRDGDLVIAVNGHDVLDVASLRYRLATIPVGDTAHLTVMRHGKTLDLSAMLIAPPEKPARDEKVVPGRTPLSGATIANLNPALAEETGLPLRNGGVVVLDVENGSYAARFGFRPGDRLLEINGQAVKRVSAVLKSLRKSDKGWHIEIDRNGKKLQVNVR